MPFELMSQDSNAVPKQSSPDKKPQSGRFELMSESEKPESWGRFLVRNTAAAPFNLAKGAASGFGLANVASNINKRTGGYIPDSFFPTTDRVDKFAKSVLPEFLTESKPGDEYAQAFLQSAPFLGAGAAAQGAKGIAKAALTAGGLYAGGSLGSAAGGQVGKALGDKESGQILGGFAGVLGGNKLGKKLSAYGKNIPSRVLAPLVQEADALVETQAIKKFETGKSNRIAGAEKEFASQKAKLDKEIKQQPVDAARAKALFEKEKASKIKGAQKEMAAYDKNIVAVKKGRSPLYEKAKKLEKGAKGDPKKILSTTRKVVSDIPKGVSKSEQAAMMELIDPLMKKIKPGTLSLKDAKTFQKNFNDQIYDSRSSTFRKYVGGVSKSINEFIAKTGSKEHTKAWNAAEESHVKLKDLQKNRPTFHADSKNLMKEISQEKYPVELDIFSKQETGRLTGELKKADKSTKEIIRAIGKERYENLNNPENRKEIVNVVDQFISDAFSSKHVNRFGLAGLASAAATVIGGPKAGALAGTLAAGAKLVHGEMNIVNNAMKNHPELYRGFLNAVHKVANAPTTTAGKAQVIATLNKLGRLAQK